MAATSAAMTTERIAAQILFLGLLTSPGRCAYYPIVRSGRGRRREASRLTGADAVPARGGNAAPVPGRRRAPPAGTRTCRQELADGRVSVPSESVARTS